MKTFQAAVWLKYGECMKYLNDISGAVQAYKKVVRMAPSHIGAKMTLSALQQQLGKHDEALEALEHGEIDCFSSLVSDVLITFLGYI